MEASYKTKESGENKKIMANEAKDQRYPFELPALEYDFDALEPVIDAETMKLHHDKHHQAYVDNLNKAVEPHSDLHDKTLSELLGGLDSLPEAARGAIRNNGGGHVNHSMFWTIMKSGGGTPSSDLASAIDEAFGSFGGACSESIQQPVPRIRSFPKMVHLLHAPRPTIA